jgi:2'-5' RNA ligase
MRLFVGLPIPSEFAQGLVRLVGAIELPKGRRTSAEDIHLTLVFLGEVAEAAVPAIESELAKVDFAPFQLRLTGLGSFSRAGILFAEVEAARPLLHLQSMVADGMSRCGLALEDRPYRPHLTLARARGSLRLSERQRMLPEALRRSFVVDAVNLYRSHLRPGGSRYEVIARKECR